MQPKPILIEISRLLFRLFKGKNVTGIDRVTLAYIEHYLDSAHAVVSVKNNIHILNKRDSLAIFKLLLNNELKILSTFAFNMLSKNIFLNHEKASAYAGCVYFNINHKGIESKAYIEKIQALKLKPIFFIHDLIPIDYPEYCRESEKRKHTARVIHMLQFGHAIVVNSEFTRKALIHFAQKHQLDVPNISVAWLSSKIETIQTPSQKSFVFEGHQYFVILATIEARKNHLLLLHLWQRLIQQMGDDAPYLVLIGQRGWEAEQVFDLLDRCEPLKQRVVELSSKCDADLLKILTGSQALLFPSYVEGYGLPLVEALSLNVPVIASDIEVFREIGQGVPDFLDPLDSKAWQDLIVAYCEMPSLQREAQLQRMQHYQHWTWKDHFEQIQALLEHVQQQCECA